MKTESKSYKEKYVSFLKAGVELIPQQKAPLVTSEDLAHSPVLKRI